MGIPARGRIPRRWDVGTSSGRCTASASSRRTTPSDLHTIAQLRAISGRDWAGQVRSIVTAYDDGSGRYARNPIYERLLVNERLSAEAERYCRTFPDARADLAAVL